ncbi:hypothetical protein, partial [Tritonibacter sp. SIMBA_163]|uniref:hypothetical protein n=1 Tax=Tritonibacter sp. SIMBA_163 TaxID=3080868 RepID=UPI003980F423
LEILKIPEILALEGQEITNGSLDWWWQFIEGEIISNSSHVRTVKRHLGVTLSNKGVNGTPIRNLQKLLKKIGMKLTQPDKGKRYGHNRDRDRKYQLERVSTHQDAIFRHWEAQLSCPAVEIAA